MNVVNIERPLFKIYTLENTREFIMKNYRRNEYGKIFNKKGGLNEQDSC
jgi:hypothetical protein